MCKVFRRNYLSGSLGPCGGVPDAKARDTGLESARGVSKCSSGESEWGNVPELPARAYSHLNWAPFWYCGQAMRQVSCHSLSRGSYPCPNFQIPMCRWTWGWCVAHEPDFAGASPHESQDRAARSVGVLALCANRHQPKNAEGALHGWQGELHRICFFSSILCTGPALSGGLTTGKA